MSIAYWGGPSHFVRVLPSHLLAQEKSRADIVDLQSIRKEILENQSKMLPSKGDEPIVREQLEDSRNVKRVKHVKYGEGIVDSENDDSITVIFDAYGSKTFSKFFTTLDFLN